MYENLYIPKIRITFVSMLGLLLTEKEEELISVLRNIRRSYPNGYEQQAAYAQMLFEELLDPSEGDGEEQ